MLLATDYPFMDILWSMVLFFAWVAWIWIAITLFSDIFRRRDIGGWHKAIWVVFIIIVPFLGVLVYLIAQHDGMQERAVSQAQAQKDALDQYVRQTAGSAGPTAEIERAKALLDAGTISQADFDAIKQKALAQG